MVFAGFSYTKMLCRCFLDTIAPDMCHLLVSNIVRMRIVSPQVVRCRAINAVHVRESDFPPSSRKFFSQKGKSVVEALYPLVNLGVSVDKQAGENNGGIRTDLP